MDNGGGCDFSAAAHDHVGTPTVPIDAKMEGLRGNGGATYTHAPTANSPPIDAGGSAPETAHRGVVRPQGVRADIRAVERDE